MHDVDVLVVGAGPAGLSLARGLAGTGLSVALIEQQPAAALAEPAFDGREIALTHASRQIMRTLGLWERIDPAQISPLRSAKVMNGSSPFALDFAAAGENVDELGWLVFVHVSHGGGDDFQSGILEGVRQPQGQRHREQFDPAASLPAAASTLPEWAAPRASAVGGHAGPGDRNRHACPLREAAP